MARARAAHERQAARRHRWRALAIGGFAFLCFFPFPALSLGATTGLQANHLISLAMIPFILLGAWPLRHVVAIGVLLAGFVFSAFCALLVGTIAVPDIMVKAVIAIVLAVVVLIPAGAIATTRYIGAIGTGASLAILVHFGVGLYQLYSYERSTFPLLWLYRNPSFLPLESVAEDYALWIKRPFGLFPEPSAMTASVGPWVVLLTGILVNRAWRRRLAGPTKVLAALAALAGGALVIMAQSGYLPFWMLAMAPVLLFSSGRLQHVARTRTPVSGFVIAGGMVASLVVAFALRGALDSDNVEQNDSWQARQQSIVIAATAPSRDPLHFLVGYGPGQSATLLLGTPTSDLLPPWYRSASVEPVIAVWSMVGLLYMEMGLIAILLIAAMVVTIVRAVMRSGARVLGLCTFLAWLAGVTLTTSYFPLSPIWLCLALLLVWDRLFVAAPSMRPVEHLAARRGIDGSHGLHVGTAAVGART